VVKATFLQILLLLIPSYSEGSVNTAPRYDTFNDATVGYLNNVYQGKDTIWLASLNGLFGLTGSHVQHFNITNSVIGNSHIIDVYEDVNGAVWFTSDGNGIYRFQPQTQIFQHIGQEHGLPSNDCWNFSSQSPQILLATCTGGLVAIDVQDLTVSHALKGVDLSRLKIGEYASLATDEYGGIWFAQGSLGVSYYDRQSRSVRHYSAEQNTLTGIKVYTILVDSKQNVWVGTELGLNRLDRHTDRFIHYPLEPDSSSPAIDNISRDLYEDNRNRIWIVSEQLYYFDQPTQEVVSPSDLHPYLMDLPPNALENIRGSYKGEMLLIGKSLGLSVFSAMQETITYPLLGDKNDASISAMLRLKNGKVLYSLSDASIYSYDPNTQQVLLKHPNVGAVTDMIYLDDSHILISTVDELMLILDLSTDQITPLTNTLRDLGIPEDVRYIKSMLLATDNTLYLGVGDETKKGIYEGNFSQGFTLSIGDLRVTDMHQDKNGNIVAASYANGVFQKSPIGNWFKWASATSLNGVIVRSLAEDETGVTWVSTHGAGLGYLDQPSRQIQYLDEGLTGQSLYISAMIQDEQGYYWVLTKYDGFVRLNNDLTGPIQLSEEDGVIQNKLGIGGLKLSASRILMAADNLNYVINTELINQLLDQRLQQQTPTILMNLQVSYRNDDDNDNRTLDLHLATHPSTRPLTLTYDEYLFSLTFASNNYRERELLRFEYRLLGLDDSWVQVSAQDNTVTYSTLPSGHYVFEVRVVDPKSGVAQPITHLAIHILPPFWLTWWALMLYSVLLVVCLFLLQQYQKRKLIQKNRLLEQAVLARTSELNQRNQQLNQSNQKIVSLLEQKKSLFANVSHEFRTPLSLIVGPLERIVSSLKDQGLKKQVRLVERNAKRLTYLVDQVLELAKLDSIAQLPNKTYPINKSLKILAGAFLSWAEQRSQQLEIDVRCTGTVTLVNDSLEQILFNLLSNGIKYTPIGGHISLTAVQHIDSLIISIKDNGPGIDLDQHQKIFERFTRIEGSEEVHGSGIGLALVKELVEANQGSIKLRSQLGQGSEFIVTLPMIQGDEQSISEPSMVAMDEPTQDSSDEEPDPAFISDQEQNAHKPTLLVVEDNLDMRTFLLDSLQDTYFCLTAKNGQEGFEIATEHLPDVIISDLMMPSKTGLDLIQALRGQDMTAHIPFVLLTAKGDEESRLSGWQLGVDDYIAKPFNVSELQARLSRLISVRLILSQRQGRKTHAANEQQQPQLFENSKDQAFFAKFNQVVAQTHHQENFNRAMAASNLAMSERQLNRKLGALIDSNFSEYLRKYRLNQAKLRLVRGEQITQVCYDVGFSSHSYFTRCFKAEFDMTPTECAEQRL
jgi:signal transduction histidine kinase/DNA-binding response OmpR family regulator